MNISDLERLVFSLLSSNTSGLSDLVTSWGDREDLRRPSRILRPRSLGQILTQKQRRSQEANPDLPSVAFAVPSCPGRWCASAAPGHQVKRDNASIHFMLRSYQGCPQIGVCVSLCVCVRERERERERERAGKGFCAIILLLSLQHLTWGKPSFFLNEWRMEGNEERKEGKLQEREGRKGRKEQKEAR